MKALRGVIAAAATPLRNDFSIDLDRLVRHCRWLLGEGGCDGVNLLGTTGEATSFSVEQRMEAMRAVAGAGLPLDRFLVEYLSGPEERATALASSFAATLELVREGFVEIRQNEPFAPLYLRDRQQASREVEEVE